LALVVLSLLVDFTVIAEGTAQLEVNNNENVGTDTVEALADQNVAPAAADEEISSAEEDSEAESDVDEDQTDPDSNNDAPEHSDLEQGALPGQCAYNYTVSGHSLIKAQQYEEAIRVLEEGKEACKDDKDKFQVAWIDRHLGIAYSDSGIDRWRALDLQSNASVVMDDWFSIYFEMCKTKELLGQCDEAWESCMRATALFEDAERNEHDDFRWLVFSVAMRCNKKAELRKFIHNVIRFSVGHNLLEQHVECAVGVCENAKGDEFCSAHVRNCSDGAVQVQCYKTCCPMTCGTNDKLVSPKYLDGLVHEPQSLLLDAQGFENALNLAVFYASMDRDYDSYERLSQQVLLLNNDNLYGQWPLYCSLRPGTTAMSRKMFLGYREMLGKEQKHLLSFGASNQLKGVIALMRADECDPAFVAETLDMWEAPLQQCQRNISGCVNFPSTMFDSGTLFFYNWADMFQLPQVQAAIQPKLANKERFVAMGSNVGTEVFYMSLGFGMPSSGYEILCSLVDKANAYKAAAAPDSDVQFHCANALDANVSGVGIVYLDNEVWDVAISAAMMTKLQKETEVGTIVVGWKKLNSPIWRLLAETEVQATWTADVYFYEHVSPETAQPSIPATTAPQAQEADAAAAAEDTVQGKPNMENAVPKQEL